MALNHCWIEKDAMPVGQSYAEDGPGLVLLIALPCM
jgi:hypothetical protein